MGCKQSKVEPSISVNKNSTSIVSQLQIIQNVSNEADKSKTYPMIMSRQPMLVKSVLSIKSEELIQHPELIVSTTLVKATKLNDDIIRPKSTEPRETPVSRINTTRSIDMNSNVSDILEVSSFSSGSSELDEISSNYGPIVSSSPDFSHKKYGKDAINRFLFVRPNRSNEHRASTHNNLWSESYTSYSLHDSFISSVSADSEGSISDPPKGIKSVFVQTKKSNVQHKTFINEPYSESDESILHHTAGNNSTAFKDVKLIPDHTTINLRSSSSSRLNNSEQHSKGITTETTSEFNEQLNHQMEES